MRSGLTRYIERGGEIVIRQPLLLRDVTTYSFVLAADTVRLGALVDRILNAPARGVVKYIPAGPFVVLVCADIARGQALHEPDRSKGWMAERDVAFWVPLWAGKQRGLLFVPERLVFFLPYAFVDNIAATVTGREIFGFPKELGSLSFPQGPGSPGGFSVDTLVIRRHDPASQGEVVRLIEITPSEEDYIDAKDGAWADIEVGFGAFVDRLKELLVGKAVTPIADAVLHLILGAHRPGAQLVFLKQFRDAADPERACYQAIVEAPAELSALHGGGWLPRHRISLTPADSHPIVGELGMSDTVIESQLSVWLRFDFTMERGVVVWSAT